MQKLQLNYNLGFTARLIVRLIGLLLVFASQKIIHNVQDEIAEFEEFVCMLLDASGHSNVLKAGKAEELKNARKRRTARKANKLRVRPQGYEDSSG